MLYLLDSSVLITSHRMTHPMDIHPSFWIKLSAVLSRNDVISIEKVKKEIFKHKDELTKWCETNISSQFWHSSNESITEYGKIQNWAQIQNFRQTALVEFANSANADPYIVSYALYQKQNKIDVTVVTEETSQPGSRRDIKIPDVCIAFDINYTNMNGFFRKLNVSF